MGWGVRWAGLGGGLVVRIPAAVERTNVCGVRLHRAGSWLQEDRDHGQHSVHFVNNRPYPGCPPSFFCVPKSV